MKTNCNKADGRLHLGMDNSCHNSEAKPLNWVYKGEV